MTIRQYIQLAYRLFRARNRPFVIVYNYQSRDDRWIGRYQYFASPQQMHAMATFIGEVADDAQGQNETLNEARRLITP